jgi:hypothetical protein
MRYLFIAPLLAVLALLGPSDLNRAPLANADHAGTAHCVEDPTANHIIDTGDLGQFTNAFGVPSPPAQLDIMPDLLPNGWVDTAEIGRVTAKFGLRCIGNTGTIPDQPPPAEGFGPEVMALESSFGVPEALLCELRVDGIISAGNGNYVWMATWPAPPAPFQGWDWGGGVLCLVNDNYNYRFTCAFTYMQVQGGPNAWDLVARTNQNVVYYPEQREFHGGQRCSVFPSQTQATVPCGYATLGWVDLTVEYQIPGYPAYYPLWRHYEPEQGFGLNPCV